MQPKSDSSDDDLKIKELTEERKNILSKITKSFISVFLPKQKSTLKESLEEILDEREEENILENTQEDTSIIRNVLEFNELYVEDVMIRRADIFSINWEASFEDIKSSLLDKTYTRIPVYKGDLDEIKGFIHIKDIAKLAFTDQEFDLESITRKCLFVPASMKISNLLIRMQQSRVHIAIVVDEYGGTEGLITLEDIMEEIVGKIEDEHEFEEESEVKFRKLKNSEYEVSSRLTIKELEDKLNITIDEEGEYETLGGLVFEIEGRIPVNGEVVEISENLEAEVLEADARTVKSFILRKI